MEKQQPSSFAGLFNNNLAYENKNKIEFDNDDIEMKTLIERLIKANEAKQEQIQKINLIIKKETNDVLKRMWDSHQKLAEIKKETYDQFSKIDSLPLESEKCLGACMMLLNKDRSFWSI